LNWDQCYDYAPDEIRANGTSHEMRDLILDNSLEQRAEIEFLDDDCGKPAIHSE